jgi:hypothetical protein
LEKWKKGMGVWAKQPSSSSLPHDTEQRRQGGRPWKWGGAPATQAMGTAGMWGKTERRSRATHSAPHLGRGRTVEGDRRRWEVCNPERHGRRWWWRWRARGGGGIGRGGAVRGGEPVRPFCRRGKVGLLKIFELQELRWPSMVWGEKYPGIDLGPASFRAARRCGWDSSCRRPLWLWGRRPAGGEK